MITKKVSISNQGKRRNMNKRPHGKNQIMMIMILKVMKITKNQLEKKQDNLLNSCVVN